MFLSDCAEDDFVQVLNSSFEAEMLDRAFQACDSQGKGKVSVFRIIEYLTSVTDPNRDGDRLQCLCKMLDPEEQGTLVDLETFRNIMTKWIACCCQDGDSCGAKNDGKLVKDIFQTSSEKELASGAQLEGYGGDTYKNMGENADLISTITDLNFANKKLIQQKSKLQRGLEQADETVSRLSEEISHLKSKLKSSQQAVLHAQSVCNENEDMKTLVQNLEDKMAALCSQKKQLEKEILSVNNQMLALREENDKLLHEKDKAKVKMHDLQTENSRILHKLCECESLLLEKDELLTQDLKSQKLCLQNQLLQAYEDMIIRGDVSVNTITNAISAQSVCTEIEVIQVDAGATCNYDDIWVETEMLVSGRGEPTVQHPFYYNPNQVM
ncbi:protein KASH5 [Pelodytes ibericus]